MYGPLRLTRLTASSPLLPRVRTTKWSGWPAQRGEDVAGAGPVLAPAPDIGSGDIEIELRTYLEDDLHEPHRFVRSDAPEAVGFSLKHLEQIQEMIDTRLKILAIHPEGDVIRAAGRLSRWLMKRARELDGVWVDRSADVDGGE